VLWPHHVVLKAGKPPKWEELDMELLVLGHMILANRETAKVRKIMHQHLQDMMADVAKYGYLPVKEFHGNWLQLIESERATWRDTNLRNELRQDQVRSYPRLDLHCPKRARFTPQPTKTYKAGQKRRYNRSPRGQEERSPPPPPTRASFNTKVCNAYNKGACQKQEGHEGLEHGCSFCLRLLGVLHPHQERHCRKRAQAAKEIEGSKNH
jgi:hypothetical protein